ncbi:MAG TPA: 50S ribosomal protein L10 [bacterium]|nr:50S ribosomal protein L10 [bacterium]
MAVSKSQKEAILSKLVELLKVSTSVAFVTTNKLTVEEISNMRRAFRPVGGHFVMAKKTLIRIAFKQALGVELNTDTLPGQVTILVSTQDPIAAIGLANKFAGEKDFAKEEKLTFCGAYFEGRLLDATETKKIASLPSRETLLAKLMGSMKSPISALARFMDAAKTKMEETGTANVAGLAALAEKKDEPKVPETPKQEEAPVETPAVEAETSAEEAPAIEEEKTA